MIKVAVNTYPTRSGHQIRGIGFYTRNLLAFLKKRSDIEVIEFTNTRDLKNVDVIHYPFFDLFRHTLSTRLKIPTVVTVHDIIPAIYSTHYPPGIKGKIANFLQKKSLKNVQVVITDSHASKNDLIKYFKVDQSKIKVVYLAPSDIFKPIKDQKVLDEIKNKYHLPTKFAFYVGDVNWNKNLINLGLACQQAGIDLVLAGKGFEMETIPDHPELKNYREFLRQFDKNSKVHRLGFVDDHDLVGLMNLASVILLPSFAEGFGLPILEAQACGTPVVTSNLSSMPEVAGEGAILVDPYKTADIKDGILKIINNQKFCDELIKKGLVNVKRFSWDKTIEQIVTAYQQAVGEG